LAGNQRRDTNFPTRGHWNSRGRELRRNLPGVGEGRERS
jgi:hypothetical protein